MFLVDTNILIRILTKDNEKNFQAIQNLIKRLETNQTELIISTIVIAECCWPLKSFYKLDKHLISEYLLEILDAEIMEVEESISI